MSASSVELVERFPDAGDYCRLRAEAGMATRTPEAARRVHEHAVRVHRRIRRELPPGRERCPLRLYDGPGRARRRGRDC